MHAASSIRTSVIAIPDEHDVGHRWVDEIKRDRFGLRRCCPANEPSRLVNLSRDLRVCAANKLIDRGGQVACFVFWRVQDLGNAVARHIAKAHVVEHGRDISVIHFCWAEDGQSRPSPLKNPRRIASGCRAVMHDDLWTAITIQINQRHLGNDSAHERQCRLRDKRG